MNRSALTLARTVLFVLVALVCCAGLFALAGFPASGLLGGVFEGAFGTPQALLKTLRWGLPLFVAALGVSVAFRAGYFNVGIQGQLYVGAIGAAAAMAVLHGAPPLVAWIGALAAACASGALWALGPGWLRIRFGANEVITTLMGNCLAALLLSYVTSGPLKDPAGSGQSAVSPTIEAAYRLSTTAGVSAGLVALTAVAGFFTWVLLHRTGLGVLASLAGRNALMVEWQGARITRLGLPTFLISGALAGLAGAMEVLGPTGRLVAGFLPGYGFSAILIALVAGLSVTGCALAAFFFGGLAAAGLYLPTVAGYPAAAIDVLNAAIALLITARPELNSGWLRRVLPRKGTS
jgi:ABC-type uncharacterized transport system permease subunit